VCVPRWRADSFAARDTTATSGQTQASDATVVPAHHEPDGGQVVVWSLYSGGTAAAMAAASAENLRFVGGQFSSADQSGATELAVDPLLLQNDGGQHETQAVTFEDDGCRGMTPMERYLACNAQPLQITVAEPPTHGGKGE
jgi:hypothetical protein